MPKKKESKVWIWALIVLILLSLMGYCSNNRVSVLDGNVALIKIEGVILTGGDSLFSEVVSSSEIVSQIRRADENSRIKAIVLEINSPGGSAVASQEIADALKSSEKSCI